MTETVATSLALSEEQRAQLSAPILGVLREEAFAILERIDRAERLATVGQLTSSVVHDLRNPLSVIETSAFVISERGRDDERIVKHAKRIADQVALAGQIISDVLSTARGRPIELATLDPRTVISGAIDQLSPTLKASVHVHTHEDVPPVLGDVRRLRQALLNLLQNAFDAMHNGGTVDLVLRRDGAMVIISVRDHGPGVSASAHASLFEPLFTTKPDGTGLGLALSREIARAHGGDITAHNAPDGGASFELSIPCADGTSP